MDRVLVINQRDPMDHFLELSYVRTIDIPLEQRISMYPNCCQVWIMQPPSYLLKAMKMEKYEGL